MLGKRTSTIDGAMYRGRPGRPQVRPPVFAQFAQNCLGWEKVGDSSYPNQNLHVSGGSQLETFTNGDFAIFTPNSKKVEFSEKMGTFSNFYTAKTGGHIPLEFFACCRSWGVQQPDIQKLGVRPLIWAWGGQIFRQNRRHQ